ncbi:MAG: 4'-phosphopantetheinyl transferase superfamily protein [Acidobacteria bacterium]|nr:4'-phosphopantetheinyl transferase superfamily protein [Acidobacteriota bacterium]
MLVGNDIVDLTAPGAGEKHRDRRFLERVFTPEEQAIIADAADPDRVLWMIWSAKEAAFKIASKLIPGTVFAHRKFRVWPISLHAGRVCSNGVEVNVEWECSSDFVHCVGRIGAEERPVSSAVRHLDGAFEASVENHALTAREVESVHSIESAAVRRVAKCLAIHLGLHDAEIVRVRGAASGWAPPHVECNGRPAPGFDVSLSHDGRFVAAAVSVGAGPTDRAVFL